MTPPPDRDDLETAALMFIHGINSARERLWIASPYFVPDEGVMYALARLDQGQYSVCTVCGNPIEPERLELLPETVHCAQHA